MNEFKKVTILVAEDDELSFRYLQKALEPTGLTMLRAANGEEAVQQCRDHPEIRLVFMDGMMPWKTGYHAAREIREFRPSLPIVILTAYVTPASMHEAIASGCNDYLAKPIGIPELHSAIQKWVVLSD
jgi:CheY-like chemotaxis protein